MISRPRTTLWPDERVEHLIFPTCIGPGVVAASGKGVCFGGFGDPDAVIAEMSLDFPDLAAGPDKPVLVAAADAIAALCEGRPVDAAMPLDLRGTPFQLQVWAALINIPFGETTTYGQLAVRLGFTPASARAVGTACGANRVSVLVPCHRVFRGTGALGGYRWGLERKQTLLQNESIRVTSRTPRLSGSQYRLPLQP